MGDAFARRPVPPAYPAWFEGWHVDFAGWINSRIDLVRDKFIGLKGMVKALQIRVAELETSARVASLEARVADLETSATTFEVADLESSTRVDWLEARVSDLEAGASRPSGHIRGTSGTMMPRPGPYAAAAPRGRSELEVRLAALEAERVVMNQRLRRLETGSSVDN